MLKSLVFGVLGCLLSLSVGMAGDDAATPPKGLENIALKKSYTYAPIPHYQFCTDPDDKIQLTDGEYTQGHFWTQKSTVGWSHTGAVDITIDLGKVQPISGVSYNTAAGAAGVTWPAFIIILVSDDGKNYHSLGDLVELDAKHGIPPADGYQVHRYWTDQLAAHGRYVKLAITPGGPFSFVDEIEVYRGSDALLAQPLPEPTISDVPAFLQKLEASLCIRHRLRADVDAVRALIQDVPEKEALEKDLIAVEEGIRTFQMSNTDDFRTIFPMGDLHKKIFAVQAAVWRAKGLQPLTLWQKNPWDMLGPMELPTSGGAKIDVAMMQNEWRAAAFNLSNAGTSPTTLQLSIADLPGGTNPKTISVCEVPFTDTKSGVPVAAALPEAKFDGQHYQISIEPGMTKQVWLTFHSKDVPAGEYTGRVLVGPGALQVPVKLKVYPIVFSDQPTLHLGGWDYTDMDRHYEVTEANRDVFIRCLREHYVDTPWATPSAMPHGKYDKDGNMIEPPDAKIFKRWAERWPNARKYFVFPSLSEKFGGFEMGTPPFKKAVAQWINWWVGQLAKWNIQPDQLGLLLVDEPREKKQDEVIIEYAKVIREAQPKVIIFNDPIWVVPQKATPEMFELSTVLCPNLPMWESSRDASFADFYVKQRDAGRELWFYSCSGPGKLLDPYAYHRMQHWFCWKYDAKGSGFWAFGDSNGASSWYEYGSSVGAYTPLFLDNETVTGGKHMEAIREGMEDYEYLRMLRDRIGELEKKGVQNDAVAAAKTLLATAADRVTKCMEPHGTSLWKDTKDRSVADQVRVEVLDALMSLSQ